MPDWVSAAFTDYARRLPAECSLHLHEVEPGRRSKSQSIERAMAEESERLLRVIDKVIPKAALVIALDERGKSLTSTALAQHMQAWLPMGRDVVLMVGGADGLTAECLQRAEWRWSLSKLTLPHAMVRVLLAEQLYRAWSILNNHPYHRE
jgi:23S rRNA (pseudouridine1915-N3)-methyltransferase